MSDDPEVAARNATIPNTKPASEGPRSIAQALADLKAKVEQERAKKFMETKV